MSAIRVNTIDPVERPWKVRTIRFNPDEFKGWEPLIERMKEAAEVEITMILPAAARPKEGRRPKDGKPLLMDNGGSVRLPKEESDEAQG